MKSRDLSLFVAGLIPLLMFVACSGSSQPSLQPIPELRLDDVSAEIRDQIAGGIASLRANEEDPDANGRQGMLLDAYSRIDEAAIFYGRARYFDPGNFSWIYLHGMALARIGDNEAAIAALEQALELRRGYPSAQLKLASLVYAEEDIVRSIGLYEALIERNPDYAEAHFEYGRVLFEQGRAADAIEPLTTALRYSNRYGKAHYTLSQAYRELGDMDKAALHLKLFERYRLFGPAAKDPLRDKISALNIADSSRQERALLLSARGDQSTAAALLEELASGENESAHINLIAVYGAMGEYKKAEEHADIAMSINPESMQLHDNIGVLRLKQNRYDEAMHAFQTAIDIDPGYSVPYKNLGVALGLSGDQQGAIANYRRAVALDPYDRQANYFLAQALLDDGQPDEAIAVIEVITDYSQPETAHYLQLLGEALQRKSDYAGAAEAFRRTVIAAQNRGQADLARQAKVQLQRVRRMIQP